MKELANLKEYLVKKSEELKKKILKYQNELNLITGAMKDVDELLSQHSFTPAKDLYETIKQSKDSETPIKEIKTKTELKAGESGENELIISGDKMLGEVLISKDLLEISISNEIKMNGSEPPFRSFFINKFMNELKDEDKKLLAKNQIKNEEIISITFDKNNEGEIKKIFISNYRTKIRRDKIIKAISWSLKTIFQNK